MLFRSEGDEFFFHETIAQRPVCAHPNPKKVLVIGGGDGGSAEEALKSNCVEKVDDRAGRAGSCAEQKISAKDPYGCF